MHYETYIISGGIERRETNIALEILSIVLYLLGVMPDPALLVVLHGSRVLPGASVPRPGVIALSLSSAVMYTKSDTVHLLIMHTAGTAKINAL